MSRFHATTAIIVALLGITVVPSAKPTEIPVKNFSFEEPSTLADQNATKGLPDWTVSGANSYIVCTEHSTIHLSGVTGRQFLFLEPFYDGGDSWVQQDTGHVFQAGTYTLTVDLGYAAGVYDVKRDALARLQFLAAENGGQITPVGDPEAIGSEMLNNHYGSVESYSMKLDIPSDSPWLGKNIVIRIGGFDGEQNVVMDNVRVDFQPAAP